MAPASGASIRDGLAHVLEEQGDRLFGLAYRVTRDRDLAADAVQAAFLSALERADSFRGQASLGTWMHRIVYNKAVDLLRQRGREAQLGDDPDRFDAEDLELAHAPAWARPDEPLDSAELRAALEEALEALTPLQRAVFEMREEEGQSSEEIGRVLGVPAGTVRVHLHRARLRLRAHLSEHATKGKP